MSEMPPLPEPPATPPGPGWWLASDGRWYPPQGPTGTNGFAIASFVLSLLWCYWVGNILALVFGYIALSQIRKSDGRQSGRGLAIAGIVISWIAMAVAAVCLVLMVVFWEDLKTVDSDPADGECNYSRTWEDPDC